jgi:hypothetical protein
MSVELRNMENLELLAEAVDLKKHYLVCVESKCLEFTSLWLLHLDKIAPIEYISKHIGKK